ncbi:MAG: hypothetical protein QGF20_07375 [Alphaproteobacteria bacterium]|jgi:hypothetical protein|nr:hypothetical protein [Alphaproteobacteria bacterium]
MAFPASTEQLILAGPQHGISVEGAQDLAPFLFELIPQWPLLPAPVSEGRGDNASSTPSDIVVQDEGGHWRLSSAHVALSEFELDDGYMLANSLIGALIAAYVAQGDGLVSIHAGAVRIGDGLVLLLGDNGAGKSTFATALASRGQRFFSDDRLVLDLGPSASSPTAPGPPVGYSLAIAPKLRLPLPQDADPVYRDFVAQNSVITWPEMALLRPGPAQAAGFGEALPLRALIHLRRQPEAGRPELTAMRQPDMVRVLLEQLFAPHLSQQGELSACVRLAQTLGIWQLRYASAFEAAETVLSHFNGGTGA